MQIVGTTLGKTLILGKTIWVKVCILIIQIIFQQSGTLI